MLGSVLRSAGRQALRSGALARAAPQQSLVMGRSLAPVQQQLMMSSRGFATVKIIFRDADGDTETVDAEVGDSILEVAHANDIEMEGACGGEMACSTCHCILDQDTYDALAQPEEEEEDMLDLALGLTETSRLGCQVFVTKEMDGVTIQLPAETANMQ